MIMKISEWKEIEYLVNNVPKSKHLQKKLSKLKTSMTKHMYIRDPVGNLTLEQRTHTYYKDKDGEVIPYYLIYAIYKLERQGIELK